MSLNLFYDIRQYSNLFERNNSIADNLSQHINDLMAEIELSRHNMVLNRLDNKPVSMVPTNNELSSSNGCSPIISAIQRESNVVNVLKRRNRIMKQQLIEYQFALELIMSKYRKRILKLLEASNKCHMNILAQFENEERLKKQREVIVITDKMQHLIKMFETKICPLTEEVLLQQKEKVHQLKVEYRGLVEMYKISKEFGSLNISLD